MLPNFNIEPKGDVSQAFLDKGITKFNDACEYVRDLTYARNSNKYDLTIILKENRGTCSSKHAALAQLAIENNQPDIELALGIYQMNATNTKGVDSILNEHGLDYMPEAHNYLIYNGERYDYTGLPDGLQSPMTSIMYEEVIEPEQITDYKVAIHKVFIQELVNKEIFPKGMDLDKVWEIREACIKAISQ